MRKKLLGSSRVVWIREWRLRLADKALFVCEASPAGLVNALKVRFVVTEFFKEVSKKFEGTYVKIKAFQWPWLINPSLTSWAFSLGDLTVLTKQRLL